MTAKVTPSTSRRGRTAWPGSTNCGRNVTKKTPSFGLLIAERNPCRKTAWAGAAGGGPAGGGGGGRRGSGRGGGAGEGREDAPPRLRAQRTTPEGGGRADSPPPPAVPPAPRGRWR